MVVGGSSVDDGAEGRCWMLVGSGTSDGYPRRRLCATLFDCISQPVNSHLLMHTKHSEIGLCCIWHTTHCIYTFLQSTTITQKAHKSCGARIVFILSATGINIACTE